MKSHSKRTIAACLGSLDFRLGWFHRYPARFSSEVLRQALFDIAASMGRPPASILDPFAGTGATLSAAKQLGIPSYGYELTHLGTLIARVRLNPPASPEAALRIALMLANRRRTGSLKRVDPSLIPWVGESNAADIDYLLREIDLVCDSRLRSWLLLALSSSLRPSSVWLSGSIKPQIDPRRRYTPMRDHFVRCAMRLEKDCELESSLFVQGCPSIVKQGSSQILNLPSNCIEAVITSPPYGSMYDYYDVHRLSYLAFSWPRFSDLQIGRASNIDRDGDGFTAPRTMKRWYQYYGKEQSVEGRLLAGDDGKCTGDLSRT